MRRRTGVGFVIAIAAAAWLATRMPVAPSAPQGAVTPSPAPSAAAPERTTPPHRAEQPSRGPANRSARDGYGPEIGFRSYDLLAEHYRKHGREFPGASVEDYLRLAQSVRDAELGDNVIEVVRADGVITRFDRKFGVFVAFDARGTLRTCFRPNDGERYFRRQAKRGKQ